MDSIYFQYNRDKLNRPHSKEITSEIKQISTTSGVIQLEGTPDRDYDISVIIDGEELGKVENAKDLSEVSFYVDYDMAKIYFTQENFGKFAIIGYYSKGRELIHINRIFDDSENGITYTLKELIKDINNAIVTAGIIKENYKTTVLANQLIYNSTSELYEYTLVHNLNSSKISISVFDSNGIECLNLCQIIDDNTLLVRNDEQEDLKIVINYGSIN